MPGRSGAYALMRPWKSLRGAKPAPTSSLTADAFTPSHTFQAPGEVSPKFQSCGDGHFQTTAQRRNDRQPTKPFGSAIPKPRAAVRTSSKLPYMKVGTPQILSASVAAVARQFPLT